MNKWISALAVAGAWGGVALGQASAPEITPAPTDVKQLSTERPTHVSSIPDPDDVTYKYDRDQNKTRGFSLLAGAGVEGYTGSLAPQISPGPNWNVTLAIKPLTFLGIEVNYSGASNNVRNQVGVGGSGPDILRNGVNGLITLGLPTDIQPYILGGVGIHHYSVREDIKPLGFRDDTSGRVPVGAGVRAHVGYFTLDARFIYSVLFDQGFASHVSSQSIAGIHSIDGGSYSGILSIGSTFF